MNVVLLGGNTKEEIEKRLKIVSAAGMLSRSEGTVMQVYENRKSYESNLKIAKNIVGFGHKTISEHDYLVFGIEDVTPIIEQTIIGYRLTSFTIKSRRNVDFRNVGFYVPDFKDNNGDIVMDNEELKKIYTEYMSSLFEKYGYLVDQGLPIEDCRYILPYSYYSNIIMGCNVHELLRMTSDLLYGKLSNITEAHELGEKFAAVIKEKVPYLVPTLEAERDKKYYDDHFAFLDDKNISQGKLLEKANMTNYDEDADDKVLCSVLINRYQLSYDDAKKLLVKLEVEDVDIKKKMMMALNSSKNQRELEQVSYSFELPISLAVLTHITRHRMHSLLVPDFVPLGNLENYISPESVILDNKDFYDDVFINNSTMLESFKEYGVRDEDLVYFYLSGNAVNIYTSMNARNLRWISRMRSCKKAQWEIRNLVDDMVEQVSQVNPLIGDTLGPACKVDGYCPEGKDSCKERGVVVKQLVNSNN